MMMNSVVSQPEGKAALAIWWYSSCIFCQTAAGNEQAAIYLD